jgi:hypothetical protein
MANNTTPDADSKTVERVQKLLALAQDGDESEEARTAALKAVRLMRETGLVVVHESELNAAKSIAGEARALARQAKEDAGKNLVLGSLLGLVASKYL